MAAASPVHRDRGTTAWLTGLPSAGKSTIVSGVAERLRTTQRSVRILDGDRMRENLTRDLAFSRADVCSGRDVKGLYARQWAGELRGLTGIDDPYKVPAKPKLLVPTHTQTVKESIDAVCIDLSTRLPR